VSKPALWTGRVLSAIILLFLAFSSAMGLMNPGAAVDAFAHLGIPLSLNVPIGVILLGCAVLYAIPQTSVLGAILFTGYFGGALMTHLRAGDPLFTRALFPVYVGVIVWLGVYLREPRLRVLVPFRS
jgi:hypothetical protein